MRQDLTHDLIVIGAGPSGATAAKVAADKGLRVALIDKAAFPRDKLCGGGVTGRAADQLERAFGAVPQGLFHDCTEVRLTSGLARLGTVKNAPVIKMTMRRDFDAALRDRAISAGAEDFCGTRVANLDLAEGRVELVSGQVLKALVVIGADGVNSQVARALFGKRRDKALMAFALEAEVAGKTSAALDLDLSAVPWGYGWDFPKAGGRTLGIGGLEHRNPDLKDSFNAWLVARGHDPASLKIKGHHLPMGEFRSVPGRAHVLLVGDAAGLVDPITGEGIAWAIHSGRLAAEAASIALSMGSPERALALYDARAKHMLTELKRARLLARIVYAPLFHARFLKLLATSGRLRRRYMDLLAGDLDYADLRPSRMVRLALGLLFGRSGQAS